MADPLSISAGAAGFLSLGIQVAGALIQYYHDIRDCPANVTNVKNRLKTLKTALENLQGVLKQYESEHDGSLLRSSLGTSIEDCDSLVEELKEECDKICQTPTTRWETVKQKGRLAIYPMRKSTLEKLDEHIEAVQGNITFMLGILGLRDNRQVLLEVDKTKRLLDLVLASQLERDVHQWFKAPDATIDKNAADMRRHEGTGQWFINGAEFQGWLEKPNSFLWVHGTAGCGKSILSSTAIDAIASRVDISQDMNGLVGISFVYLTFNDSAKQDVTAILKTFILQLCGQSKQAADELQLLYNQYKTGSPSTTALKECLQKVKSCFREVFLVIDGVDESPQATCRRDVLTLIRELRKTSSHANAHLLVTSRDEIDIRRAWEPFGSGEDLQMQDPGIDDDIKAFVRSKLQNDEVVSRKWIDHLKMIEDVLIEKAQGIFRWVECQFEAIRDCPRSIRDLESCLNSLPPTLDKTYERMLLNISGSRKERARRLLLMLCTAPKPMSVEALIEGLAIVLDESPYFDDKSRLRDGNDLMEICPGLIFFSAPWLPVLYEVGWTDDALEAQGLTNQMTLVQIAHFSVQEFLHSTRIASSPVADFMIQTELAYIEMTEICLAKLIQSEALIPHKFRSVEAEVEYLDLRGLDEFAARCLPTLLGNIKSPTRALGDLLRALVRPDFQGLHGLLIFSQNWSSPQSTYLMDFLFGFSPPTLATPLQYALWSGIPWLVVYVLLDSTFFLSSELNKRCLDEEILDKWSERLCTDHKNLLNCLLADKIRHHRLDGINDREKFSPNQRNQEGIPAKAKSVFSLSMIDITTFERSQWLTNRLNSCLLLAANRCHSKLVSVLLSLGADVNATGDDFLDSFNRLKKNCSQDIKKIWHFYSTMIGNDSSSFRKLRASAKRISRRVLCCKEPESMQIVIDTAQAAMLSRRFDHVLQVAAYETGNHEVVQLLLDAGAHVNARGGYFGTALHAASFQKGNTKVVKMLLDAGADVNAVAGVYRTALVASCCGEGNVDTVKLLLDAGADVNAQVDGRKTALQEAVGTYLGGNFEVIHLLLAAGADVNAGANCPVGTALMIAVNSSLGIDETELLVKAEADLNATLKFRGSFAHPVSINDSTIAILRLLLEAGADVNASGGYYGNPLQAASANFSRRSAELVKLLLDAGADVNAVGGRYATALQAACDLNHARRKGRRNLVSSGINFQIIKILLEAGADPNIKGGKYGSALNAVRRVGDAKIERLLREAGSEEVEGLEENVSKFYDSIGDDGAQEVSSSDDQGSEHEDSKKQRATSFKNSHNFPQKAGS